MPRDASELAHRLAREAEAVCRHYLSNGRREGRYWLVGDVQEHAGPLDVRPAEGREPARAPAGKWTDAATGEHGDLLDVIRESCGLVDFHDVADEARRFLSLPRSEPEPAPTTASHRQHRPDRRKRHGGCSPCRSRSRAPSWKRICADAALRLCTEPAACASTRAATIGPDEHAPTETWPAMIAAVTDLDGRITGAHRTWLDPADSAATLGKAPIDTPRRAMGDLLGNAVRFGVASDVLAAGEGIETMLSLRCVLPTMPMVAALSASASRRHPVPGDAAPALYRPRRRSGRRWRDGDALIDRAQAAGIEAIALSPRLGDFNEDLRAARHRRASGSVAGPARAGGRRPLHGARGDSRNGERRRGGIVAP